MWPLAQHSLYFWTFILFIQAFKLCLYTEVLLCFSGTSGKAEVKRDNLQMHTLKLQFWFLQSSANSKNKHHSTTLRILETAFKSQNAPKGIRLHSQELNLRTSQKYSPSNVFKLSNCKSKATSTLASMWPDKSGFIE